MNPVTLIDTGPIVAAIDRRDEHHMWSYEQFGQHPLPFLTCEAVLTEAAYLLARSGISIGTMLDLVVSGTLRVAFDMAPETETLKAKLARYQNVPMDLADACLVRMHERHPGSEVLTLDSDFRIYRTDDGEPIPAIIA